MKKNCYLMKIKLKYHLINLHIETLDFASQTTEANHNNDDGSADLRFMTVDLTSDPDVVPIEQPSVIVISGGILNDANKSNTFTQAKKRKHVTFRNAEIPEKKQKFDTDSNKSITRICSISTKDNRTDNSNKMPYKCPICAEEYNRNSKLVAHMKTHMKTHEKRCKLKRYECYLCKIRRSKGCLLEHMSLHTGVEPFRCSHCLKCFISNHRLSVHTKRYHKKSKQTVVNVVGVTK